MSFTKPLHFAVIGVGRVGQACADLIAERYAVYRSQSGGR